MQMAEAFSVQRKCPWCRQASDRVQRSHARTWIARTASRGRTKAKAHDGTIFAPPRALDCIVKSHRGLKVYVLSCHNHLVCRYD